VIPLSRELDHVGIFARSIEDIALLFSVLATGDDRDPDCFRSDFGFWIDRSLPCLTLPKLPSFAVLFGHRSIDRRDRSCSTVPMLSLLRAQR
jgi:hypothetical protein